MRADDFRRRRLRAAKRPPGRNTQLPRPAQPALNPLLVPPDPPRLLAEPPRQAPSGFAVVVPPVGIESAGRRLIYINAFHLPDDSGINPAREAIRVCDGGAQFWGAVFDPASNTFSELQFNGGFGGP